MARSDTLELSIPSPAYHLAESWLFAYPTRMASSWGANPERILQPSMDVDPAEIRIQVSSETTHETRRSRNPVRWLRGYSTLSLTDKFVFDARFEVDQNIAHQLEAVAAPVLLARQSLAPILGGDPELHVILKPGASPMAREIYRILGIPVLLSDARIAGRIVRVSRAYTTTRIGGKFCHRATPAILALLPEIFRATSVGEPDSNLPEKIFISRKSSRFLINDREISQLLESRGFRKYYFEDIPVREQLQVVAHARQLVAIHGAALATTVFNQRGLTPRSGDRGGFRMIELFGPGYIVDYYRRYAAVLNAHWCVVRGKITPEVVRDLDERGLARSHEKSPFAIDPGTLEAALEYSDGCCSS